MVNAKKPIVVNLENELLEDMIEEVAKQLHNLHIELFDMLHDVRELQMSVLRNKADIEVFEKINIDNDIINLD
jgi:hypothetical protein